MYGSPGSLSAEDILKLKWKELLEISQQNQEDGAGGAEKKHFRADQDV